LQGQGRLSPCSGWARKTAPKSTETKDARNFEKYSHQPYVANFFQRKEKVSDDSAKIFLASVRIKVEENNREVDIERKKLKVDFV
jgi:hypothetical protein